MNTIIIRAKTPCYINKNDDCGNPIRLTPYVKGGEVWLASEGNGCGNDIVLEDLSGWTDREIDGTWCDIDLAALRVGADEIESAGDKDSADYIRDWASTCEQARARVKED